MSIYAILPLISGLFILGLGIFIFLKNRKLRLNQIFFLFTFCLAIWLIGTFIMFISKEDAQKIFWDRIVYIGAILTPIVIYHFGLLFVKIKTQQKLLYLGYFLAFIFLLLSRTDYFIADLYKFDWGVHTQARFFHHIFLVFMTFYVSLFLFNIYQYYQRTKGTEQVRVKYVFFAILILALGVPTAFLPAYGIDFYPATAYFSVIIFVIILSYAIIKQQLFEIKLVLTQLLVGIMAIVLLVLPFLIDILWFRILLFIVFLLFCFVGYLLIKSVLHETKHKEILEQEVQERTKELQGAYEDIKKRKEELEKFHSLVIDREVKMVELKKRIRELEERSV